MIENYGIIGWIVIGLLAVFVEVLEDSACVHFDLLFGRYIKKGKSG